jgi:hypothetical protein
VKSAYNGARLKPLTMPDGPPKGPDYDDDFYADAADSLPGACPFTLDDICRDDWYPEPEAKTP